MTLTVALLGRDGIVLASDSRATYGDPRDLTAQDDTQRKIHQIANCSGVLVAGDGGVFETLLDLYKSTNADGSAVRDVKEVAEGIQGIFKETLTKWLAPTIQGVNAMQFTAPVNIVLTLAGYAASGDPCLYSLHSSDWFVPRIVSAGFVLGGVPQYGLYLMMRLYERERSVEDLKHLSAYAIMETSSQDGKVGGPVQMSVIEPTGGYKEVQPEEVKQIIERNQQRSDALRRSFYGGSENGA